MPHTDLSLKALIRAVSTELLEARAERLARGDTPLFQVSELTLEVSFVVTDSEGSGLGFDLKVIKADKTAKYDQQSVHRILLKMTAIGEHQGLTELGDEFPLRPQPEG